jgi:hypothetical protein
VRYCLFVLLVAAPILSQQSPEAPSHSFFDTSNQLRMAAIGGLIAADGITTQHILTIDHGRELNPFVRPLVTRGPGGQVAASLLGYTLTTGTAFLFHKMGHHKLERLTFNISMAIETECVTSNLVQIATAPRTGPR